MMQHTFRLSVVVVIAAVLVWLPLHAAERPTDRDVRIVAQVGNRQIRVSDLDRERAAARRRDLAANRLDSFTPSATRKMLDELIAAKLLASAARDARLDERPDVRDAIEQAIDLVLAQAMTAQIVSGVDTSEQALRGYYNAHAREFEVPGRVKARHIVVKTEAEAVSLLGRLKRNADFAALAREHNTDASKEKGGDLGWVSRGVMVKAFEEALFSLPVGGLSSIVRTPFGFHIIKVEEIQAGRPKPFDSVADEVRQRVVADQIAAARAALAKKHPITVNDAVLKSLR